MSITALTKDGSKVWGSNINGGVFCFSFALGNNDDDAGGGVDVADADFGGGNKTTKKTTFLTQTNVLLLAPKHTYNFDVARHRVLFAFS